MKKSLIIFVLLLPIFSSVYADDKKSCNNGYDFYKTNDSKSFPIFRIESSSNKKIKITKLEIKGFNNELIYEINVNLIIDPYSVKTFEPFNPVSGVISFGNVPNLNPKVIKNYFLTCEWHDNKTFNQNNNDIIMMCAITYLSSPTLPKTYDEYLNDENLYFRVRQNEIDLFWDWIEGRFLVNIPIETNDERYLVGITNKFWDINNKNSKIYLQLDKYTMETIFGSGYLEENFFTKDEIKMNRKKTKCKKIESSNLGRLKPRVN